MSRGIWTTANSSNAARDWATRSMIRTPSLTPIYIKCFDHNVGRLSAAPSSSVHDDVQDAYEQKRPAAQEPAISMVQLLQNPLTLRNAFILSEVLRRPEF